MASEKSRAIRATLPQEGSIPDSIADDRREWEAAVAPVNQALDATVTPVDVGGVPGEWVAPPGGLPASDGRAILYLHGGGFIAGSPRTHRALAARIAAAAGAPLLLLDYRLAPEHPAPAGVEDAAAACRWLIGQGFAPERLAIGGDSAGGGLALAALVSLSEAGDPLPACGFLLSPWVDLTLSGPSIAGNAALDPRGGSPRFLQHAAKLYAGAAPTHPLASPLFAELAGLPPLLIQAGGHEILLSDATRLAERAAAAGVRAELRVWDEMWHVFQVHARDGMPEALAAIAEIGAFVHGIWDARA